MANGMNVRFTTPMARRTDILSERQKESLRLALTMTSDQIAAELSRPGEIVTAKAVNGRIDAAREKLGGLTRRQAAELLAREEGRLDPERYGASRDKIPRSKNPIPSAIESDAVPVLPSSEVAPGESPPLSADRQIGRRRNELDLWQRLGIIILAMAMLAGAASAYIIALRH